MGDEWVKVGTSQRALCIQFKSQALALFGLGAGW